MCKNFVFCVLVLKSAILSSCRDDCDSNLNDLNLDAPKEVLLKKGMTRSQVRFIEGFKSERKYTQRNGLSFEILTIGSKSYQVSYKVKEWVKQSEEDVLVYFSQAQKNTSGIERD